MTKKKTLFITIFILLAVLGIGMTSFKQVSVGNLLGSTDVQEREFMEIDCTAGNPNCPRLAISGDFADKSKFHGFADPSMRRDPNSGIIWLSFSWARVVRSGSGLWSWFSRPDVAVDIHLARSNDGGASWKYAGQLWQAHTVLNPVTKVNNIVSYETANISAQNKNGKTIWHAIHWDYLLKPGGFIYSQIGRYSYFRLSMVSSPYRLPGARPPKTWFAGAAEEIKSGCQSDVSSSRTCRLQSLDGTRVNHPRGQALSCRPLPAFLRRDSFGEKRFLCCLFDRYEGRY